MKLVMAVIKPFTLSRTGNGKIFVLGLQSPVRMRTGDTDAAAI